MALLLAICGDKVAASVKEVPLSDSVQKDVLEVFSTQETAFRQGEERPFDENWLNERDEIVTASIPANVSVFDEILKSTDTALSPVDTRNLEEVHGLAMKVGSETQERILVQLFASSQLLGQRWPLSLLLERGTYTRLESSAFRLDDNLVCIVESGLIKFRSLHNLGRVIDTSAIFRAATDGETRSFATLHSSLFEIPDVDRFVAHTSRNARKYMKSLARSGVLQNHTAQSLQAASAKTKLVIEVRNGRILMPTRSGEVTELMRFLNDGRYVGPVSGDTFITNSRRRIG